MRFRRPLAIKIIAALYLLAPIFNVAFPLLTKQLTWDMLVENPSVPWGKFGLVLLLVSPLIAAAIYSKSRWGFATFLLYSAVLLAYHGRLLTVTPSTSTAVILATDLLLAVSVSIMLTREVRAPYLAEEDRGWRMDKRYSCYLPVRVEAKGLTCDAHLLNVSVGGALVAGPTFQPTVGETVLVTLDTPDHKATFSGVVERVSAAGCGISFQNLSEQERNKLVASAQKSARSVS